MGIKSKLKHTISFLLHGEAKPIYASIHYLAPNEHLKGKKIVITGGGRGLGFAMANKLYIEQSFSILNNYKDNIAKYFNSTIRVHNDDKT